METKPGVLREKTGIILKESGLRKTLAGFQYILDAADLIEAGAELDTMLLKQVAAKNGRTYTQVRQAILRMGDRLDGSALTAELLRREKGPDRLWNFLESVFLLAGRQAREG